MNLTDEKCLDRFRGPGSCEGCLKWFRVRDAAHIYGRGAGRVDAPINLVSLCRTCHNAHHNGRPPTTEQLLKIAAQREGTTPERIEAFVWAVRRAPKESTLADVILGLEAANEHR